MQQQLIEVQGLAPHLRSSSCAILHAEVAWWCQLHGSLACADEPSYSYSAMGGQRTCNEQQFSTSLTPRMCWTRCSQAIFAEDPKVTGSAWADISDEAKDFVKKLLNRCVVVHTPVLRTTHVLFTQLSNLVNWR